MLKMASKRISALPAGTAADEVTVVPVMMYMTKAVGVAGDAGGYHGGSRVVAMLIPSRPSGNA